jgi:FG-GAP-like repeat/FlgD Ig-like domain
MPRAALLAVVTSLALSVSTATSHAGTCTLLNAPIRSATIPTAARLATGDFNADGILDLAVTHPTANMGVQFGQGALGLGNGQFDAVTTYTMVGSRDVIVADFNGDGILDLAVTSDGGIGIRLGQGSVGVGNGTFGAATNYTLSNTGPVVAGDFNEDGFIDLVVGTSTTSYSVTPMIGNGTGTFTAPTSNSILAQPKRIAVGDFNADGRSDLALLAGGNAVVIMLGTGTGTKGNGGFSQSVFYVVGVTGSEIVTGDFNADGRTDLAFPETGGLISVMLGQGTGSVGDGTFAAPVKYPVGASPRALGVGDLNGDGVADLAVSLGADSVAVMTGGGAAGAGDGTFHFAGRFATLKNPGPLRIGDFYGDGQTDILVASADSSALQVFPGSCSPFLPVGVSVTAPNGGEAWPIASEQTIAWSKGAGVISVDVELSRDAGNHWVTLASNLTGTSIGWTVTPSPTGSALVRVHDSTVPTRNDRSNAAFSINPTAVGVSDASLRFGLGMPTPNPFRRNTRVEFSLPNAVAHAQVIVRSVDGRAVARLHEGPLPAGAHTLVWDGRFSDGRLVPPGIYFIRVVSPDVEATRQIVRLR